MRLDASGCCRGVPPVKAIVLLDHVYPRVLRWNPPCLASGRGEGCALDAVSKSQALEFLHLMP